MKLFESISSKREKNIMLLAIMATFNDEIKCNYFN